MLSDGLLNNIPPSVALTILLLTVALAITALSIVRLPTIPAYFIAGGLAGPKGLAVLYSSESVDFAAEIGIILLLFTIGLKFNLRSLKSIRSSIFRLGLTQVMVTTLVVTAIAAFWVDSFFVASLIGFVVAMSSTAIISQILIEENIVSSPIGRRAMGILIFQDIIVIPLIIVYSDSTKEVSLLMLVSLLVVKIVSVLAFVLFIGPKLMRKWLNWVAHFGNKDLFIVHIVVIIIVSSVVTSALGLSHVLGAFLAGILIAETYHRHRIEQAVEPFRQLFLGFFFVTLGALIDPHIVWSFFGWVLLLAIVSLLVKIPILYACVRFHNGAAGTAAKTAMLVGGAGEFGFVLLAVANGSGILSETLFQVLVPSNMLALIMTPFLWRWSEPLVRYFLREDWAVSAKKLLRNAGKTANYKDHIVVCGFGRTGQAVAGILSATKSDFVVIENDYLVLESVGETGMVIYGSGDHQSSLLTAGILRAKVLIITYYERSATTLAVQLARRLNRNLYIIGKAHNAAQAEALLTDGADEALVDSHESGLSLAGQCLRQTKRANMKLIMEAFSAARRRTNTMFQGVFTGSKVEDEDDEKQSVFVGYKAPESCAGKTLREVVFGATVVSWRRGTENLIVDDINGVLQAGDDLVLSGDKAAIDAADALLKEEGDKEKGSNTAAGGKS